MARHPSRLFDIDIFDTNFMEPQKEAPKDSIDYNLLTKSQQRFIHKQLKELKRDTRKTEEEILLEKLQTGKVKNLPKGNI